VQNAVHLKESARLLVYQFGEPAHQMNIPDGGCLFSVFLRMEATQRLQYNSGYTNGVKTAVSLPEEPQQANSITQRLDDLYSRRSAKMDSGLHRAQLKSLEKGTPPLRSR
jgi:hypothetical protein